MCGADERGGDLEVRSRVRQGAGGEKGRGRIWEVEREVERGFVLCCFPAAALKFYLTEHLYLAQLGLQLLLGKGAEAALYSQI